MSPVRQLELAFSASLMTWSETQYCHTVSLFEVEKAPFLTLQETECTILLILSHSQWHTSFKTFWKFLGNLSGPI